MNVFDYIDSPDGAVKKGYQPCYLTKVSAVVSRSISRKVWNKHMPKISLDDSVKDFTFALLVIFWMIIVAISIPITCWVIAFIMPGRTHAPTNRQ